LTLPRSYWPRHERQGRHTAEAVMQSLLVVFAQPVLGDLAHLLDGFEHVGIEHLVSIGLVEALDEGVLIRFAWRDEPS
jgi:hypothetical protein